MSAVRCALRYVDTANIVLSQRRISPNTYVSASYSVGGKFEEDIFIFGGGGIFIWRSAASFVVVNYLTTTDDY